MVLKEVLGHFHTFIKMVYFGWTPFHVYILWEGEIEWRYILDECSWIHIFHWWVGVVAVIFGYVGRVDFFISAWDIFGWRYIFSGGRWIFFYQWVGMGDGIFWLGGGEWIFFVGRGQSGWGGWRIILGKWGCVNDIFYEWVGVVEVYFELERLVEILYEWVGVGGLFYY